MWKPTRLEPKIRFWERLLYYWKKKKIKSQFAEISDCWSNISNVLDWSHYDLSKNQQTLLSRHWNIQNHHLTISKVTNERVKNIEGEVLVVDDTLSRHGEEQTQRRPKKEEESLRKALSLLEFLARQRDLFSKCFPRGQWFLESVEFTSWIKARPWQLKCYADTGCGKVHCGFNYLRPESNSLIRPVFPPLWWITCVLITKLKGVQYFENIWAKKNSKIIYQNICLVACWDNWSRRSARNR